MTTARICIRQQREVIHITGRANYDILFKDYEVLNICMNKSLTIKTSNMHEGQSVSIQQNFRNDRCIVMKAKILKVMDEYLWSNPLFCTGGQNGNFHLRLRREIVGHL